MIMTVNESESFVDAGVSSSGMFVTLSKDSETKVGLVGDVYPIIV